MFRHTVVHADAAPTRWSDDAEASQPVCPQFRPYPNEAAYPVRGHCAPLHRPGWFVIPSIEEYGLYCTETYYACCPWYRGEPDFTLDNPLFTAGRLTHRAEPSGEER